jgi:lipopolysaccharide transport system permease protein
LSESGDPFRVIRLITRNRGLIWSMVRREVSQRYRGSFLGPLWTVLTPVVQIVIFTLIFSGIFQARFGGESSSLGFAVHLFCGLLPWIAFSETLQRSTTVVRDNVNLVKRVVFPVAILPVNIALAGLVQQIFGTLVLLAAARLLIGELTPSILWFPALVVPQLLATLGLSWLVAGIGVYLRDTTQAVNLLLMSWMYLTPIFYPESIIPAHYSWIVRWNPMAPLIRSYRLCLLEGRPPDWSGLVSTIAFALLCWVAGSWWFERTRGDFADLL